MSDITINTTSGSEVEGRKLDNALKVELFGPNATDIAVVNGMNSFVMDQLAIVLAIRKGWTYANSEAFIASHTTIIS